MNEYLPILTSVYGQATGQSAPPADGGSAGTESIPGESGGRPAGGGVGGGTFSPLLMIVLMFVVFYLLLIRPQQKKAKEHQKMLGAIGKGDEIVTNGGLIGRVVLVKDKVLTVELAEKIRVRVLRTQVAGRYAEVVTADESTKKDHDKKTQPNPDNKSDNASEKS